MAVPYPEDPGRNWLSFLRGTTPNGRASRGHHPSQGIPPDTCLVHNVLPRVGKSQSPGSSGASIAAPVCAHSTKQNAIYALYLAHPKPYRKGQGCSSLREVQPLGMYSQTSAWRFPSIGSLEDGVASAWEDALNFINLLRICFLPASAHA